MHAQVQLCFDELVIKLMQPDDELVMWKPAEYELFECGKAPKTQHLGLWPNGPNVNTHTLSQHNFPLSRTISHILLCEWRCGGFLFNLPRDGTKALCAKFNCAGVTRKNKSDTVRPLVGVKDTRAFSIVRLLDLWSPLRTNKAAVEEMPRYDTQEPLSQTEKCPRCNFRCSLAPTGRFVLLLHFAPEKGRSSARSRVICGPFLCDAARKKQQIGR